MQAPALAFSSKAISAALTIALALSMAPFAWADDESEESALGTIAESIANPAEQGNSAEEATTTSTEPEATAQQANASRAQETNGNATGTTIKIAVYRSSYAIVWDLNDAHGAEALRATWDAGTRDQPSWWPQEGSPGSPLECPAEYVAAAEPQRIGYTFSGWSTDPTAPKGQMLERLELPKDAPLEGEGSAKHMTLYAIWTPIEYSVAFDLTKNPEDASAVPSFRWVDADGNSLPSAGSFSDLGGGRYRLSGITLEDYDPETGLIEIAVPSRGTGGYRFLSWAEPEGQQSPTVAMKPVGGSTWYVNPVALPYYDYEPVLTARWSLSFDVDVPSQITFDQYDVLEQEGTLSDTTEKDMVDEESPDAHDRGKAAHFCSQSTATDYKIVALHSEKQPTASDVLTSSDWNSTAGTGTNPDDVLGTGLGTGEKLLSLFADGTSEDKGVHFRLDDSVDMDSERYDAFIIPRQDPSTFDASATDRDDESRLYVSYRLNLSNEVEGHRNHGLVVTDGVQEGARTPIAKVSYEFAVADVAFGATEPDVYTLTWDANGGTGTTTTSVARGGSITPPDAKPSYNGHWFAGWGTSPDATNVVSDFGTINPNAPTTYYAVWKTDALWVEYQSEFHGLADIKAAANDMASKGTASSYYSVYAWFTRNDAFFHLQVGSTWYDVRLIGIAQDTKAAGGKAGLTFAFKDIYAAGPMNTSASNANGWPSTSLRNTTLNQTLYNSLGAAMRNESTGIVSVKKVSQKGKSDGSGTYTTTDKIFVPSSFEVFGANSNVTGETSANSFQYDYFRLGGANTSPNPNAIMANRLWWLRSGNTTGDNGYYVVHTNGALSPNANATYDYGILPCFAI